MYDFCGYIRSQLFESKIFFACINIYSTSKKFARLTSSASIVWFHSVYSTLPLVSFSHLPSN